MTRHSRDIVLNTPDAGRPVLDLSLPGLSLNGAEILGPVSLSVAMGETLALTGPSGIGKSTLLNLIAGQITAPGQQLTTRGSIGMVFQSPTLLPWRSACDNLTLTTGLSRAAAGKALAEVGLAGKDHLFPGQMSLGQQRRLSLARAFARAPQLLLLDEPFVSLDPDLADNMMALFARMRAARGSAAILVTHSQVEIGRLATRVLRLDGKPATLLPA
ncbi:ATP-binding cassette domain-containing protein [Meridianimarinicoccus sp. MJW13]|uniref:ATP-binding cassette domain-containing protein n=1 Tax=Meridianimarinicoccus sp. MJW13 TaxID=2720031 RepID=UPI0018691A52|nr:ATP-binding cassette domain-containing protein [Fluviibacterium sp. MJW13]